MMNRIMQITTGLVISGAAFSLSLGAQSIVHSTSADFSGGTFSHTEDLGTGTASIQLTYSTPFGFGNGHDGSATISGDPNTRATCSGSAGSTTLTTGLNASAGDIVLIHQSQYGSSGSWELNRVVSDNGSTLTLENVLFNNYGGTAQAVLVPQYSSLTISGGGPAAWNGSTGGIYAVICSGTVNITGTLSAVGSGYRGGAGGGGSSQAYQGESYSGTGGQSNQANGGGGGGGRWCNNGQQYAGGGGGYGSGGSNGSCENCCGPGYGGGAYGTSNLSTIYFGSGGGGYDQGGSGGGIIYIQARQITVNGQVQANGNRIGCGAGMGAGGAIYLRTATLSANTAISAVGVTGNPCGWSIDPGDGGVGRIRVDYATAGGYAYGNGSATTHVNNACNPDPGSTAQTTYNGSGTYLSAPINIPGIVSLGTLQWTASGGTSVKFRTRTAATAGGLSSAAWSDYLTVSNSQITSTPQAYIQYEVTLTGTTTSSPALTSVTINYNVPSSPAGMQPSNKIWINTTTPRFVWLPSTDPQNDPLHYTVTIDDNADLSSPIVNAASSDNGGLDPAYTYIGSGLSNGGTYYWQVTVSDGSDTATSQVLSFRVDTSLPGWAARYLTSADFADGTFTRIEDLGSGASPSLQCTYSLPYDGGDGRNGSTSINWDPNTRASCTGSAGSTTLTTALNASAGDIVMVHQSRGTGAGNWEMRQVVSDNGATLTLDVALSNTYTDSGASQAQVVLVPQYDDLTIAGSGPADWNGDLGGIYAVVCRGTLTLSGTLSGDGRGFRGAAAGVDRNQAYQGESYNNTGGQSTSPNAGGGGGGRWCDPGKQYSGAGGGHATAGGGGSCDNCCGPSYGGSAYGTASLAQMYFGSGGGGYDQGGDGGGIVYLQARQIVVNGSLSNRGTSACGGGLGAGGSVLMKAVDVNLTGAVNVQGYKGNPCGWSIDPGDGGDGYIRVDYIRAGGNTYGSGGAGTHLNTACTPDPGYTAVLSRVTSGSYLSDPIEIAGCTSFGTLDWTVAGGISVSFRTRTAASADGLSTATWSLPLTATGSQITSSPDDWVQYEVTFAGTSSNSPALSAVTVNFGTVSLPSVTQQPSDMLNHCPQTTASFSVQGDSGGGTLSYQWQKDGLDVDDGGRISGATTATLQISSVQASDAGDYVCVLTNEAGTVSSDAATLSVNGAPTLDQSGPIALQVARNSTCPDTLNEINLSGSDPNGDALSWSVKPGSGPTLGTVSFPGGNTGPAVTVCYQPNSGITGSDSFVIQASDGCVANVREVTIQPTISDRPVITAWRSVKDHGTAGPLALAMSGSTVLIDPRRGGPNRVEVDFSLPVRAADNNLGTNDVVITSSGGGTRTASGLSLTNGGLTLVIALSPGTLEEYATFTVDLSGKIVAQSTGLGTSGDADSQVRLLPGDVNGSGGVTLADVSAVKSNNRVAVTATTAKFDLNGDGKINLIDAAMARSLYGN